MQEKIDNIESSHPGYDEYRYNLDMIGHDPHEPVSYTHLDVYKRQDILNNFKRLGVAASTLDGKERLSQLHAVFHMDRCV